MIPKWTTIYSLCLISVLALLTKESRQQQQQQPGVILTHLQQPKYECYHNRDCGPNACCYTQRGPILGQGRPPRPNNPPQSGSSSNQANNNSSLSTRSHFGGGGGNIINQYCIALPNEGDPCSKVVRVLNYHGVGYAKGCNCQPYLTCDDREICVPRSNYRPPPRPLRRPPPQLLFMRG